MEQPSDELKLFNEEQRRYSGYADNATVSIQQLETSLELQKELLKFFNFRIIECADK